MTATPASALDRQEDSPAQVVLESFLADALGTSIPSSESLSGKQAEIDLRTDILYALTDRIAYRRAWPLSRLIDEVRALQVSGLAGPSLTDERINVSLRVLLQQRLVREFDAPKEKHYELAHDFLVRYVVRTYRDLERRRISQLAVLTQQKQATEAEFALLSKLSNSVNWLLRLLPVLTFGLTIGFLIFALKETVPEFLGISYLWFLALPGAALLLLGVAARRLAPVALAALVLVCCGGSWFFEYSTATKDITEIRPMAIHYSTEMDWCKQFADSAASGLLRDDYSQYRQLCGEINLIPRSYGRPNMYAYNMIYNARGLQGKYALMPNANFCYDVSQVFESTWTRRLALLQACWNHTPDWSLYLAHVQDPEEFLTSYLTSTGIMRREYEVGKLSSSVGWFPLLLLISHLLIYPAVLLGTIRNVTRANALRRVASEIVDVVVMLATLIGFEALIISLSTDLGRIEGFFILPFFHLILYVGASSALLIPKHCTVGMLILGLRLADRDGSREIPAGRLIGRSVLLWIWGLLNLFFGIPVLVITPLYVWLRKDHQLLWDGLLKLRVEAKQSIQNSDVSAAAPPRPIASTASAASA